MTKESGWLFLSTPSARRATTEKDGEIFGYQISIHALREEGDMDCCSHWLHCRISIHALREEGDLGVGHGGASLLISIHALREEGDRLNHARVL